MDTSGQVTDDAAVLPTLASSPPGRERWGGGVGVLNLCTSAVAVTVIDSPAQPPSSTTHLWEDV